MNSSVDLSCRLTDPTLNVVLRHSSLGGGSHVERVPDGNKVTKAGQVFTINNLLRSDAGAYECRFVSQRRITGIKIESVAVVPASSAVVPMRSTTPQSLIVHAGERAAFSCRASGRDIVSVKWFKDKKELPSAWQTKTSSKDSFINNLQIRKTNRSDGGEYECRVRNHARYQDYWPARVQLLVDFDFVKKTPLFIVKIVGDIMTLDCSVSIPNVVVTLWLQKIHTPLHQLLPDAKKVTQTGQNFTISQLTLNDAGLYKCIATSNVGRTIEKSIRFIPSSGGNLNPKAYVYPFRKVMKEGESFNFSCQALGDGTSITWLKSGSVLPKGNTVQLPSKSRSGIVINEKLLTIKSMTKAEEGNYTCKVVTGLQPGWQHQKTVELRVDICSVHVDGKFADPLNAAGYIQCSNSVEERKICPASTKWDNPSKTCKPIVTTSSRWIGRNYEKFTTESKDSSWQADCRLDDPAVTVELIMRGRTISGSRVTLTGQIFTINRLSLKDSGNYYCSAPNDPSLGRKKLTELTVVPYTADEGLDVEIRGEKTLELDYHDSKEILCESRINGVLEWYKVGRNGKKTQISKDDHKTIFQNTKSLFISGHDQILRSRLLLKEASLQNSGTYVCNKTNMFKRSKAVSIVINVKAVQRPSITGNSSITADTRDRVTLSCDVTGSIKPNVTWLNDGVKIGSCTRAQSGRCHIERVFKNHVSIDKKTLSLVIKRAKYEDRGKYRCVARNLAGQSNRTVSLTVRVRPKITKMAPLEVRETKALDPQGLTCVVQHSVPRPNITWEYQPWPCANMSKEVNCVPVAYNWGKIPGNIGFITPGSHQGSGNRYESTLSVNKNNLSGFFRCTAQNPLGTDEVMYAVRRYAKPFIFPFERILENVDIGGEISFECRGRGIPTPTFVWKKRSSGKTLFLPVTNSDSVKVNKSVLHIKNVTEQDYGEYKCVAKNERGTSAEIINFQGFVPEPDVGAVGKYKGKEGVISEPALYTIVAIGGVLIFVLLIIIIILYRRKKLYGGFYIFTLPPMPDYIRKLDPDKSLIEQTHKLPYDAEWEFPRERLVLGRPLGSGQFGQVYLAEAVGIVAFDPRGSVKRKSGRRRSRFGSNRNPYVGNKQVSKVAVKLLKEGATQSEYRDLVSELKILMHVGEHKNIVNLRGACTKGRECDVWVIIEYCPHGNMLDFLRMRREIFDPRWTTPTHNPDMQLTAIDLVIVAYQVARAMEFLTSRKCVHRDLAARNVLVGEDYVVKVADFGLARDIYKEDHYVKTTAGLLPVKWMAIEALVDRIYTHQSDVWSFGIFMWELFTLGGSPYPGIPANEMYNFLMSGKRMEAPVECPDDIYSIMTDCWMHAPTDRPNFTQLVERIDKIIEKNEGGEGYLNLENEDQVEKEAGDCDYLHPHELSPLLQTPSLENFNTQDELPPLPLESIELNELRKSREDLENTIKLLLDDPSKGKLALRRVDSEMEKVRRDCMEKEKPRGPESQSGSGASEEEELFSEKERQKLKDDEDKDLCERNSGVFEYPPPYEERCYKNLPSPTEKGTYGNLPSPFDVGFKNVPAKERTFRSREPSARYVEGV